MPLFCIFIADNLYSYQQNYFHIYFNLANVRFISLCVVSFECILHLVEDKRGSLRKLILYQ